MLKLGNIYLLLAIAIFPAIAMSKSPDIILTDMNGKDRHISEFIGKGQWTVVVIWAEDCEVCNAEIETYDFFHDENKDKNARILGVSIDGKKKIGLSQDFVKRHSLTFPNLIMEPDMNEIYKFGGGNFIGTPTIYIFTPDGEIVAAQAGAVPVNIIEDFIAKQEKL